MNNIFIQIAITLTLLLGTGSVLAQDNPQLISIPLSTPGEPMTLDISMLTARIEVIGEDREDVQIAFTAASEGPHDSYTIRCQGDTRRQLFTRSR